MAKVVARQGESLDSLLRRFKRKVVKENILGDLRRKEEYEKPSERKVRERNARKKVLAKLQAKYNPVEK